MEALKGKYSSDFICDDVEGTVELNYDYSWFEKDSLEFNFELARFCAILSVIGYDTPFQTEEITATGFKNYQPNLERMLRGIGFTDIEINACAERDEMSYFMGRKEIELESGRFNLVMSGFIGSYKRQWFSNFDPNGIDREANDGKGYAGNDELGVVHLGFADAREYMAQQIEKYLDKYPSEYETKLLLIGHSRGAAAANMLAVNLFKSGGFGKHQIKKENIYTYCYATPNFIKTFAIDDNPDYDRIMNILNPEDFVTKLFPVKNGFGKFGRKFYLMGSDNNGLNDYSELKASMQEYYTKFVRDIEYHPFKKGNNVTEKVTDILAGAVDDFDMFYNLEIKECFKPMTIYEYFKETLCTYIAGARNEEELAKVNRAMYLLIGSAFDLLGTSYSVRKISSFFVLREGLGVSTGNKIGATYFSDSHRADSYAAMLLAMDEETLMENSKKFN